MIQPLYDRIVIKRAEGQKETAGGIVIPDNAVDKPQEAEVLAVGIGPTSREFRIPYIIIFFLSVFQS